MSPELDLTNRTICGFRILARVAAGGVGTVWKGEHLKKGKLAAIKIMNADLAKDKKMLAGFQKEFDLCGPLKHPGVVRYYDFGFFKKYPVMLMEFFPGDPLKSVLNSAGRGRILGNAEAILTRIAEALGYVHEHGIIHRDVKPENILVNAEGETRLIDFSAAEKPGMLAGLFGFGRTVEGTPSYMAPEQIEKKKPTPAVDMYSFGCMIYEMFAARPPFIGNDINQVLNKHLKEKPLPVTKFNSDISPGLDKLVLSMLAKSPDQRPTDMAAFVRRLKKAGIYIN